MLSYKQFAGEAHLSKQALGWEASTNGHRRGKEGSEPVKNTGLEPFTSDITEFEFGFHQPKLCVLV